LPQELGSDPLLAHRLVMLPVVESLPKAAYYLIQRRDSRQTPLAESLITQFRREAKNRRSGKFKIKKQSLPDIRQTLQYTQQYVLLPVLSIISMRQVYLVITPFPKKDRLTSD
jgi:hypothetical protein